MLDAMARARGEDLLEASLSSQDDLRGFRSPWNPWSTVFVSFFGGPLTAAFLLSENFVKLGRKEVAGKCALGFVLLAVALAFGLAYLLFEPSKEQPQAFGNARLLMRAVTVIAAGAVAHSQMKRFKLYCSSGKEAASLWLTGLVAAILGGLMQGLLFAGVLILTGRG
jgi:hypothetical protein